MTTTLVFSDHGRYLDIIQNDDYMDVVPGESLLNSDVQAHLNCLLFTPCTKECNHRQPEAVKIRLDQNNTCWLVELLILAIRYGDKAVKCRAITIAAHINSERISYEVACMLNNESDDVHWTAVETLRRLRYSNLLSEWNYR